MPLHNYTSDNGNQQPDKRSFFPEINTGYCHNEKLHRIGKSGNTIFRLKREVRLSDKSNLVRLT